MPEADAAQKSAVGLSVRAVAARAAAPIPEVWAPALNAAARSKLGDLPDALDRAVAKTDLGLSRKPFWWTAVGLLQWLFTIAAVVGLGWLIAGYAVRDHRPARIPQPQGRRSTDADVAAARRPAPRCRCWRC